MAVAGACTAVSVVYLTLDMCRWHRFSSADELLLTVWIDPMFDCVLKSSSNIRLRRNCVI